MATQSILVLLAHGSRDPRWREPFETLKSAVGEDLGPGHVELAYMEFHPPSLEDIAVKSWSEGIVRIRVLPLFLAGGAHVANDIPAQVQAIKQRLPGMEIEVLPPVGEDPLLQSLLQEIAYAESLRLKEDCRQALGAVEG